MDPIPGLDFCPAGIYYFPKRGGTGTPRLITINEFDSLANTGCLVSFDDIPRGYSTMGLDADPPVTGWTRLSCEILPDGNITLIDNGFVTGERECNNFNGGGSTSDGTIEILDNGLRLY